MKEEEVDDEVKEIFRRQRAVVGHVPPSESKGCRVRSLNERAGWRSHVLHTHTHTLHVRASVYAYLLTERCNDVCVYIYIYITRFTPLSSIAGMCERDCYVKDVSDRKRDCERTGGGRRGRNRMILNDPE